MKHLASLIVGVLFAGLFCAKAQDLVLVGDQYCTVQDSLPYNGSYRVFYPDGTVKAAYHFLDGRLHYGATFYSEDGHIESIGSFYANKRHGLWQQWTPDGRLVARAHYEHGVKDGKWMIRSQYDETSVALQYAQNELVAADYVP